MNAYHESKRFINAFPVFLHTRSRNCLIRNRIKTMDEFMALTKEQMRGWPAAGDLTISRILKAQKCVGVNCAQK